MRKLRDRRGITLTEMLCTVLIVLLLTALLVVGIRFAGKTYTESMRLSEALHPHQRHQRQAALLRHRDAG